MLFQNTNISTKLIGDVNNESVHWSPQDYTGSSFQLTDLLQDVPTPRTSCTPSASMSLYTRHVRSNNSSYQQRVPTQLPSYYKESASFQDPVNCATTESALFTNRHNQDVPTCGSSAHGNAESTLYHSRLQHSFFQAGTEVPIHHQVVTDVSNALPLSHQSALSVVESRDCNCGRARELGVPPRQYSTAQYDQSWSPSCGDERLLRTMPRHSHTCVSSPSGGAGIGRPNPVNHFARQCGLFHHHVTPAEEMNRTRPTDSGSLATTEFTVPSMSDVTYILNAVNSIARRQQMTSPDQHESTGIGLASQKSGSMERSRRSRPTYKPNAVKTLRAWFEANWSHSIASPSALEQLVWETGMTTEQVRKWIYNTRFRSGLSKKRVSDVTDSSQRLHQLRVDNFA